MDRVSNVATTVLSSANSTCWITPRLLAKTLTESSKFNSPLAKNSLTKGAISAASLLMAANSSSFKSPCIVREYEAAARATELNCCTVPLSCVSVWVCDSDKDCSASKDKLTRSPSWVLKLNSLEKKAATTAWVLLCSKEVF